MPSVAVAAFPSLAPVDEVVVFDALVSAAFVAGLSAPVDFSDLPPSAATPLPLVAEPAAGAETPLVAGAAAFAGTAFDLASTDLLVAAGTAGAGLTGAEVTGAGLDPDEGALLVGTAAATEPPNLRPGMLVFTGAELI